MTTNEELQGELQALRDEVARLRHLVGADAAAPAADPAPARLVSRRNLLRAAPVVAAGGVVAAMAASPAAAAVGDAVIQGEVNDAGSSTTMLKGGTPWDFGGIDTSQPSAFTVDGGIKGDWINLQGISVGGNQGAALYVAGDFLQGDAAFFAGAPVPINHGETGATAVGVSAMGPGVGVKVDVTDGSFDNPATPTGPDVIYPGIGLQVTAATGPALDAQAEATVVAVRSTDTGAGTDAVTIAYAGTSRAFYAESTTDTNINGTVTGVNDGAKGIGMWGEQRGTGAGFGVVGVGGKNGRGGRFTGGAAALQMPPSKDATHPISGKAGDFFVDSSARLWFCTGPGIKAGGNSANWKRIA